MAVSQPTPATLVQNTYALDKLIADIKARVGSFLANEKAIFDAKAKLDGILSSTSAQIKANAQALKAKADSLLKIQADVEKSAQSLIGRASDIRTQMETNPLYSFLKTSPTYWGLRQYELLGTLLSQTASMLPEGTALSARVLKQNTDVKQFVSEVDGTEKAAAGTGVLPKIQGVINSTLGATAASLSPLLWPIAITAAGAFGLYILSTGSFFRRPR